MPELAEVEFYRKRWDSGLNQKIERVHVHETKRIFRGTNIELLRKKLTGAKLLGSQTHGKQMLFRFSGNSWLGIHLGMTGEMSVKDADYTPEKHDHLVLFQKKQALVFRDPRQFGRVIFDETTGEPAWWQKLPPRITSDEFTLPLFVDFLKRHRKAPVKAVLLLQSGFPGIGNWMVDEILWQAKVHPNKACGDLKPAQSKLVFEKTRFVASEALKIIGHDFSDPPKSWLFLHRWKKGLKCPRCATVLKRSVVGGRTTCFCPVCQKEN